MIPLTHMVTHFSGMIPLTHIMVTHFSGMIPLTHMVTHFSGMIHPFNKL